jgi:hypothetical protein
MAEISPRFSALQNESVFESRIILRSRTGLVSVVADQTLRKGEKLPARKRINQKERPKTAQPYKYFGLDDAPKGKIIHLMKAKEILAHFRQKGLGGPNHEFSEEFVKSEIVGIARIYRGHQIQAATAPRVNVPRESFAAMAKTANELRELISNMGDVERIMFAGADVPRKLYLQARVGWLPQSLAMQRPDSESKWLSQLAAFAELSLKLLATYNQEVGPDVGGRTNVHTQSFNSPEYVLIGYAWSLFEKHKPGQATGGETGEFHQFVQEIYEYATGKGANEVGAPALINKIKEMLKPLRRYQRFIEDRRAAEKLKPLFFKKLRKGVPDAETMSLGRKYYAILARTDWDAVSALKNATVRRRYRR